MVLGGCRSFHVVVTTGPQLTQCLRVNITFLMKVTCILIRWVLPNCKEMLVFFAEKRSLNPQIAGLV